MTPYLDFSREQWLQFRKDTPMVLNEKDLAHLHGQIEQVSLDEVEDIYLPLSRLLNLYIEASQNLYHVTTKFLGHPEPRVPYIIGIAGSVAVGKSTTSRILQALLSRWPKHRKVEIVTTDGFLFPNAVLEERGLMNRKGFPESYDSSRLIQFLWDVKAGKSNLQVPIYSHESYDIIPDHYHDIGQLDLLILEGINVLQAGQVHEGAVHKVFVSDFFDFTIYVDAQTSIIEDWFIERFCRFRKLAANQRESFFYQFSRMAEEEAIKFAHNTWANINLVNLEQNILPFKKRAQLILHKGVNHAVEQVLLRKL